VLFDFGGTLDADGIHWAPRFYGAYRAAGGQLDYPAFERHFSASGRELGRLPGIKGLGFRSLVEAQAQLVCRLVPDGAGVDPGAIAQAFHAAAVATVARNRPVLDRLRSEGRAGRGGYRLGVISNFTGNLDPCLVELDLRRCFEVVADSGVVGVSKPDPRIFSDALVRLGVPPGRAWMVGDNFETDIRPAAALGLATCWLAPPDRPVPAGGGGGGGGGIGTAPTARIARLLDLEDVLSACTA